jgi:starvation-inducible outer membrane lipoprotein
MRLYFLIFTTFLFSACTTTPEVTSSTENTTTIKIQTNQSVATEAQNEYKMLQVAREKEYS